jgi:DNA-binding CsgD family transcriptional regulator
MRQFIQILPLRARAHYFARMGKPSVIEAAFDLLADCAPQMAAEAFGAAYLEALRPYGAKSLWARTFRLTPDWVDPEVNCAFETQDHVRIRQADWQGSTAQKFADRLCPLAAGAEALRRPFFASHVAPREAPRFAPYWEAMAEFDVRDTLAVPHWGPNHTATAFTIWFTGTELSPDEVQAIQLSALMAMEHVREPYRPQGHEPLLTQRERDCLAFVADGLSDHEIAERLGISHHTAHAHVESAKQKLGAKTRAQAVARGYALMEILLP